jgi:hypothetical protein
MEFEIVKRNYNYLLIYGCIILLIFILGIVLIINTTGHNDVFGSMEVYISISIAILLFIALKIVPYLKLSKHTKIGYIQFSTDTIFIHNESKNEKLEVSKLDILEIKLCGYDGQPRTGDVSTYYPAMRPLDGLNNNIRIANKKTQIKYELYIDSINDYEKLKKIVKGWSKLSSANIKILR